MYDVITIGDVCQDIFLHFNADAAQLLCEQRDENCHICFQFGEKVLVTDKHDSVGGNAANAAVSCARLGKKVAIYTHYGSDRPGQRVRDHLKEEQVNLEYATQENRDSTNYNTVISFAGERTILAYHQPRDYQLPELPQSKWLYLTSMRDGFERLLPDIVSYKNRTGAKICYQPGTFQLRFGADKTKDILQNTDLLFMNKQEAEHYLGYTSSKTLPHLLYGLRDLGAHTVCITDGIRGSYAIDDEKIVFLPVIPDVPRVDATGAGDAFSSACLVGIIEGLPLEEAMAWGQLQATSVIQEIGAQSALLSRANLLEWKAKYVSYLVPEIIKL